MDRVKDVGNLLRTLTCFNFYRGWRGISEYYRHYLPEGVSAQQSYILELCDVEEGIDVGTLAGFLEIDSPAISSMLRRMEASGLVRREVMASNRRRTLVFLTQAGKIIRDDIRSRVSKADKELLKHLSEAESEQLALIVEKIFHAISSGTQPRASAVSADKLANTAFGENKIFNLPTPAISKTEHYAASNLPG